MRDFSEREKLYAMESMFSVAMQTEFSPIYTKQHCIYIENTIHRWLATESEKRNKKKTKNHSYYSRIQHVRRSSSSSSRRSSEKNEQNRIVQHTITATWYRFRAQQSNMCNNKSVYRIFILAHVCA